MLCFPVCLEAAGNAFRFREVCERSYEYLCKMLEQTTDVDKHYDMCIKEGRAEQEEHYELCIKGGPDIEDIVKQKQTVDKQYSRDDILSCMGHKSEDLYKNNEDTTDWMLEKVTGNPVPARHEKRVKCAHCSKQIRRHLISYHINTHSKDLYPW